MNSSNTLVVTLIVTVFFLFVVVVSLYYYQDRVLELYKGSSAEKITNTYDNTWNNYILDTKDNNGEKRKTKHSNKLIHKLIGIDDSTLNKDFIKVSKQELMKILNTSITDTIIFIKGPWTTKDNWYIKYDDRYYVPEGLFVIQKDKTIEIDGLPKKEIFVKKV